MQRSSAETFVEKAIAHNKATGGVSPVINRAVDVKEWQEWRDYFRYMGMKASFNLMGERTTWTVPTLDVKAFDPVMAVLAIEQGDRFRKRAHAMDASQRKWVVDNLTRNMAHD